METSRVVLASAASSASASIWSRSFDKMKFVNEPVVTPASRAADRARHPAGAIDDHRCCEHEHCTCPAATVKANPWYPDHAVYNATKTS